MFDRTEAGRLQKKRVAVPADLQHLATHGTGAHRPDKFDFGNWPDPSRKVLPEQYLPYKKSVLGEQFSLDYQFSHHQLATVAQGSGRSRHD